MSGETGGYFYKMLTRFQFCYSGQYQLSMPTLYFQSTIAKHHNWHSARSTSPFVNPAGSARVVQSLHKQKKGCELLGELIAQILYNKVTPGRNLWQFSIWKTAAFPLLIRKWHGWHRYTCMMSICLVNVAYTTSFHRLCAESPYFSVCVLL